MSDRSQILRPQPRRPFELTPSSTEPSTPATPSPEASNPELLDKHLDGKVTPSRTRSLLNLTSSTLFGIYSDVPRDEPPTPAGSGAITPSFRLSGESNRIQDLAAWEAMTNTRLLHHPRVTLGELVWSTLIRSFALFTFGVAGGMIITHLHDSSSVVPVKVGGVNRRSWSYIAFWGTAGVILGNLLPWIDTRAQQTADSQNDDTFNASRRESSANSRDAAAGSIESNLGADWNPAVRGIGAFVGIALAIRRLQWQSTMQASLTLGLVNPCLWYMVDRTWTGFGLSTIVGVLGTALLLTVNPAMVPPPTSLSRSTFAAELSQKLGGDTLITDERIGVATWIASVLFCSSVCFGNIGRRLAMDPSSKTA